MKLKRILGLFTSYYEIKVKSKGSVSLDFKIKSNEIKGVSIT